MHLINHEIRCSWDVLVGLSRQGFHTGQVHACIARVESAHACLLGREKQTAA
jgi:hypothetical protein